MEQYSSEDFFSTLPFKPTNAQQKATEQIYNDMCSGNAMNRLIQGDVGSGKTLVAAAAAFLCVKNGKQAAFMAPTEILAEQHYKTFCDFLGDLGVKVGLLTGSMTAKEKREVKKSLAIGEIDLIIGTHALLTESVEFSNLALVITDEQHRFGVAQRSALNAKAEDTPHILVMSATPIPRTLALMLYGDLDVSVIDELPPGRKKIDTFLVDESFRERINAFISKQVQQGHQVFVICPAVEESVEPIDNLKSVAEHAKQLSRALPDLRISSLHGKMKATEKDRIMKSFANGELDVLVSTTVVEVGVDIPNASLIVIENAERFGLSQLHQLRGRVGRGTHKSYCVMFSDNRQDETVRRLQALCKTNDGFKISEEDLKLRGPGDFFGSRQHGLPEMHIADLCTDMNTLLLAQKAAQEILSSDSDFTDPENELLSTHIVRLFDNNKNSMN